MEIIINGTEYELSNKLRVAYKIQGMNAHKPYTEIFSEINNMPIEKQIEMLYAAFEVANPEAKSIVTYQKFLDHYLDNSTIKEIMDQLQQVISGILGEEIVTDKDKDKESDSEGN